MCNTVASVWDSGDLYGVYATKEIADRVAKLRAKQIATEYPDSDFASQVVVHELTVYDTATLA
jgi:hypothetical protein